MNGEDDLPLLFDVLGLEILLLQRSGYANSIELKVYQAIQALAADVQTKHLAEMALLNRILETLTVRQTGSFNPQSAIIS